MPFKKNYKHLVDNYKLFTAFQIYRFRKKYPSKALNDKYQTDVPTVHFIHRYITNNTGDLACGYYQYFFPDFEKYKCIVHDVNSVNFSLIRKTDIIIVGGGGLLNATSEWNFCINKAAKLAGKAVIWSAGFNSAYKGHQLSNKIDFKLFDLVSVRDFQYKDFRYAPCATCVIPELHKEYTIERNVGVVAHKDVPSHLPKEIHEFEKVTNSASLQEMVEFIATSQVVFTNSYHAVYWSILLQRKCILFAPRSEKYDFYKYPPVKFSGNLEDDIAKAVIYPEAMEDSMSLTLGFLKDIKSLIEQMPHK